jgi:hypothetical protein
MRQYKKKKTEYESGYRKKERSYSDTPNDIGPENEGEEGYLSPDSDSDAELVGRRQGPRFERSEDAIPAQSVFIMRARHRLACIGAASSPANRVKAICTFFTFILQPAYVPFLQAYSEWREKIHTLCDQFTAESADDTLQALCKRFKKELA